MNDNDPLVLDEGTAFVEALASLEDPSIPPKADESCGTLGTDVLNGETICLSETRCEDTDMGQPVAELQEGDDVADMMMYALEDSEFSRVCFGTVRSSQ
jgi:hypothetical protein